MAAPATLATSLLSLGALKAALGQKANGADAQIARLGDAATALIETYTGWRFVTRTHTEVRDGHGDGVLHLFHWPVVDVTSVSIRRSLAGGLEAVTSGYTLDAAGGRVILHADVFPRGIATAKIVYSAGYGAQDAPTLPADIVQVLVDVVKLLKLEGDNGMVAASSLSLSGTQMIIRPDWPKQIRTVLDAWRKP